MPRTVLAPVLLALLIASCTGVQSISDPYEHRSNPAYRGELDEFDMIGIDPTRRVEEDHIRAALNDGRPLSLPEGSSIVLIQSGAEFPDLPMRESLEAHYRVSPFSGVPRRGGGENLSRVLRLAAAKGGHAAIVCYWGILESTTEDLATKGVSWVPILGYVIPDETRHVRIRIKMLVLDVATGRWETFATSPGKDRAVSGTLTRDSSEVRQVDRLKAAAYAMAAEELSRRFGG